MIPQQPRINPPQFGDLSARELGALTEGCGIPEFDPPELWFHDSCRYHDFLYWRGGDAAARADADATFLEDMLHDAAGASNPISKAWRSLWAYAYYFAVRWFGGSSFPAGEKTWDDVAADVEAYYEAHPHEDPMPRDTTDYAPSEQ